MCYVSCQVNAKKEYDARGECELTLLYFSDRSIATKCLWVFYGGYGSADCEWQQRLAYILRIM